MSDEIIADVVEPVEVVEVVIQEASDGAPGTITIGTVTTGAPGSAVSIVNVGTPNAAILNITIPRGNAGTNGTNGTNGTAGTAATVTVGAVTMGLPGSTPTINNVGTPTAALLNFQLPGSLFPVLLGSVRAAAYNYNGSNQTINRYGLQPSAFLSSTISPTSNFTKGTYGEVIATGQTYNIGHGSFTNHTAPETYVWLVRLTSGSANAKMRARSYNLFYNSGTLSLWYADIAALGSILITKTIVDGDIICCAWSGNANTTRAALLHGGTVQSASKESGVYAANATSFGTLQVGAGNGGAGGGIEFIGAFSFAGLMSEDELKMLVQVIYAQNMP